MLQDSWIFYYALCASMKHELVKRDLSNAYGLVLKDFDTPYKQSMETPWIRKNVQLRKYHWPTTNDESSEGSELIELHQSLPAKQNHTCTECCHIIINYDKDRSLRKNNRRIHYDNHFIIHSRNNCMQFRSFTGNSRPNCLHCYTAWINSFCSPS